MLVDKNLEPHFSIFKVYCGEIKSCVKLLVDSKLDDFLSLEYDRLFLGQVDSSKVLKLKKVELIVSNQDSDIEILFRSIQRLARLCLDFPVPENLADILVELEMLLRPLFLAQVEYGYILVMRKQNSPTCVDEAGEQSHIGSDGHLKALVEEQCILLEKVIALIQFALFLLCFELL